MQFLEQLTKNIEKIGEFDPKFYYSNDYSINSDQRVGVPQKDYSITFLQRGEGVGVLQNDYSITFWRGFSVGLVIDCKNFNKLQYPIASDLPYWTTCTLLHWLYPFGPASP